MSEALTNEAVETEQPADLQETAQAEHAEETEATEEVEEESATSEDDEQQPEKPKRRSRAEERINALTREKYEAQQQAQQARQQYEQMQAELQRMQNQPKTAEIPNLADYDYDEGRYQEAMRTWSEQQMTAMQEQQAAQLQQYQQQQEMLRQQQVIQRKLMEGQEKHPDFMAKVNDPTLPNLQQISPAAFEAVVTSDASADVLYYLASNPGEIYSLADMNPMSAIRKVMQIEARLTAKPQSPKAPPNAPPSRVAGNSEVVRDPENMSTAEWLEWRRNDLKAKQR